MSTSELIRQIHLKSPLATIDSGYGNPNHENPNHENPGQGDSVAAGKPLSEADSLIGLFQNYRPDGKGLRGLFSDLAPWLDQEIGLELEARLERLFEVAGDDRRPQGGRDAYFVVRRPPPISVEQATTWATKWVSSLAELAINVGDSETAEVLDPLPGIRVLEGVPPKHPRSNDEKTTFLSAMQQSVPSILERVDAGHAPAALRQAYYFISCDPMLRDYLMWPLFRSATAIRDPFLPYFELWRHGVKYRIFQEKQMDLYLPRR